jgi:DNA-binding CsgD family transcriptional regulator
MAFHSMPTIVNFAAGHSDVVLRSLTVRERQVAKAVATGASNHQVAMALSMAARTVECHLGRIYTKLGVGSRIQLAVALDVVSPLDLAAQWPSLSLTERHVVALVGVGMTTRLAAKRLCISPKTVEYHLARIYRKLQITSRRQLLYALANVNTPERLAAIPETAAS